MDNNLTMNEFMDLIFSQNDALNVDLSKVPHFSPEELFVPNASQANVFLEDIRKDAEQLKENRIANQWKFFIQKNLNNISLDILKLDSDKSSQVDPRELLKVIERRAMIPEYLKQNREHLERFVGEFVNSESGKVQYRDLIDNLRNFNYERATNERGVPSSHRSSAHSDILGQVGRKTKTIFDDDYIVLDS